MWYNSRNGKEKEFEFDKLARLIREEGEDIRSELSGQVGGLRKEMHEGVPPSTGTSTRSSRYNAASMPDGGTLCDCFWPF